MEDALIHEDRPSGTTSRLNVEDDLLSQFVLSHTRLDLMEMWFYTSHGEQLGTLNNRTNTLDGRLARMERNQEHLIGDLHDVY